MITVNKTIVHFINKNIGEVGNANPDYSANLLQNNDESLFLISTLNSSYINAGITYGVIDFSDSKVYPREFRNYSSNNSDREFVNFTRTATEDLNNRIRGANLAKGGYLVFSDYSVDQKHYLTVFLIRDTKGIHFSKSQVTASFIINDIEHLDLDKLAMACRIDLEIYNNNDGRRYLSVISKRQKDISDYFIDWISLTNQRNNKILTEELYNLIENIPEYVDTDGSIVTHEEFQKRIFDFVMEKPTKIIDLHELSDHFFNDDQYLTRVAEENQIIIDSNFQANIQSMKRFSKVEVNSDGINLKFSRIEMDTKISFSTQNPDIVMIRSASFARELRTAINRNES